MKYYDSTIMEIMDQFDFIKVHKVMHYLNWEWSRGGKLEVPTIGRLVNETKRQMEDAADYADKHGECITGCGGFRVQASRGTGEEGGQRMFIRLSFEVTSWDNYL